MSRSKSFLSGAFFAYLHQGAALVAGLWLTPFYLHVLGAKDYGIWLVGLQVLTFLLLADLGVIGVLPRDVGRLHGLELSDPNSSKLATLVWQTVKVASLQTVALGGLAVALFLLRIQEYPSLKGPVGLILVVFVATYPLRIFPAVLVGLQDLKFLGKLRAWLWAASTALAVVMLFFGARFYALACGWCLQEIGGNLIGFWRLRTLRPDLADPVSWNHAGRPNWRWLKRGSWVSLGQVAMWLLTGADILVVARSLGTVTVVIYSCTQKLIGVLQNQPSLLAGLALPGLSQMRISESQARTRRATVCLTQAMLLVGGAVFCVAFPLNKQFVGLWVGSQFFGGVVLTALIGVNFLVRLIDHTLALALFAFGYEKVSALRCMSDGVVSITIASLLVGHLGLVGVMIGFLAGALLVGIPIDAHYLAKELNISYSDIVRPYLPYLWRTGLVGALAFAILRALEINNLISVAIAAAAIGLVYLAVVIPYVRRSELGEYIGPAVASIRSAVRSRVVALTGNA